MRKPLVIIGGMGPQASLRFHQLVVQKSERYHSGENDAYPHIVHYSLPVSDFISNTTHQKAAVTILRGLTTQLALQQPVCITLVCNTAHVLAAQVAFLRQRPFLSLIDTVADRATQQGFDTVGLLATPTTITTGLYNRAFDKHAITILTPDTSQLQQVERVIRAVIAGTITTADRQALAIIARQLANRGAQAIVLGCTELPLAFAADTGPVPVLDCLDIYADAAVEHYYLYNKE